MGKCFFKEREYVVDVTFFFRFFLFSYVRFFEFLELFCVYEKDVERIIEILV